MIVKNGLVSRLEDLEAAQEIEDGNGKVRIQIYQLGAEQPERPDGVEVCVNLPDNGRNDALC